MKKLWTLLGVVVLTPLVTLATTLVPPTLPTAPATFAAAKPFGPIKKVFYDKVDKQRVKGYDWAHPHIKLANDTKERAKFILYYRDFEGKVVPIKKQDEKGNESTEANTFILDPGKDILFLHDKYDFKNAPGKCIVKVEARILKPNSDEETGEWWYIESAKGYWCIDKPKGPLINKGYYGWRIKLQDTKDGKRELVVKAHSY